MFASVTAWLAKRPVSDQVVARARELWVNNGSAHQVARMLKLDYRAELYQLRPYLDWPRRHVNYPTQCRRIEPTWTEAELRRAEEQWYEKEPAKVIAKTLHLGERRQVYVIARQQGWGTRDTGRGRPRGGGGAAKQKRAAGAEVAAETLEQRTRGIGMRVKLDDLPTDHLSRLCPVCDGRVIPDPEHPELWVRTMGPEGSELVHARCLPAGAKAA
jgi:hypothetical protein